jgi:hypothetical protein
MRDFTEKFYNKSPHVWVELTGYASDGQEIIVWAFRENLPFKVVDSEFSPNRLLDAKTEKEENDLL